MKKLIKLEFIIVIFTLVLVLPLAFSMHSTSVTKYDQTINDENNQLRYLSFDLQKGQSVTGSYTLRGVDDTLCVIVNPDGDPMVASPTNYEYDHNHALFSFIADSDGRYYLSISGDLGYIHYIDYTYSISPQPILGFDPMGLIALVISIATVLTAINFLVNLNTLHMKKGEQPQPIK
jgi:hypothetical protein